MCEEEKEEVGCRLLPSVAAPRVSSNIAKFVTAPVLQEAPGATTLINIFPPAPARKLLAPNVNVVAVLRYTPTTSSDVTAAAVTVVTVCPVL